jgi:hypothetical protein
MPRSNELHESWQDATVEKITRDFWIDVKPLTKCLILQLYYNSFYDSFEIY